MLIILLELEVLLYISVYIYKRLRRLCRFMFNIDTTKYRVIDISMPVVPGKDENRYFRIKREHLPDGVTWKHAIETHTHVGTHVEAPKHTDYSWPSTDEIPLDRYYGRAVVACFEITGIHVPISGEMLQQQLGDIIRPEDIVIIWVKGIEFDGDMYKIPYLTVDTASWLIENKVKHLVLQNTNFDIGENTEENILWHRTLQKENILASEFIYNAHQISKREVFYMGLPYKCQGLDSAWCRSIVIEENT